jgi:hypothetical protein
MEKKAQHCSGLTIARISSSVGSRNPLLMTHLQSNVELRTEQQNSPHSHLGMH